MKLALMPTAVQVMQLQDCGTEYQDQPKLNSEKRRIYGIDQSETTSQKKARLMTNHRDDYNKQYVCAMCQSVHAVSKEKI